MFAIFDYFRMFCQMLFSIVDLFKTYISDFIKMLVTFAKLPSVLSTVLQWTNAIGVFPYIFLLISIVIFYKIVGREG